MIDFAIFYGVPALLQALWGIYCVYRVYVKEKEASSDWFDWVKYFFVLSRISFVMSVMFGGLYPFFATLGYIVSFEVLQIIISRIGTFLVVHKIAE